MTFLTRYYDTTFISLWVEDPKHDIETKCNKAVIKLAEGGANEKILKIISNDKVAYHSYVIQEAFGIDL